MVYAAEVMLSTRGVRFQCERGVPPETRPPTQEAVHA
jgi:hypothetical protein